MDVDLEKCKVGIWWLTVFLTALGKYSPTKKKKNEINLPAFLWVKCLMFMNYLWRPFSLFSSIAFISISFSFISNSLAQTFPLSFFFLLLLHQFFQNFFPTLHFSVNCPFLNSSFSIQLVWFFLRFKKKFHLIFIWIFFHWFILLFLCLLLSLPFFLLSLNFFSLIFLSFFLSSPFFLYFLLFPSLLSISVPFLFFPFLSPYLYSTLFLLIFILHTFFISLSRLGL